MTLSRLMLTDVKAHQILNLAGIIRQRVVLGQMEDTDLVVLAFDNHTDEIHFKFIDQASGTDYDECDGIISGELENDDED